MATSLSAALKSCDSQVKEFVRKLKAENAKLQKEIVVLEVKNLSKDNRIKALEKAKPAEKAKTAGDIDINARIKAGMAHAIKTDPAFAREMKALLAEV